MKRVGGTQNYQVDGFIDLVLGRYWTLFTCSISHQNVIHLAFNMIATYTFGSYIFHLVGFGGFVGLCLGAAATSSLAYIYSKPGPSTGLGMSGIATSIATTAAVITPLEEIVVVSTPMDGNVDSYILSPG